MRFLGLISLLITLALLPTHSWAQAEAESSTNALVLTQTQKQRTDTVMPGRRVEVVAKHHFFVVRGDLKQVTDSSIVVGKRSVPLRDVKQLYTVNRTVHWVALSLVYVGLALLLAAAILPVIAAAYLRSHPSVPRTGQIDRFANGFGFPVGLIALLAGDVVLIFRGRRYKLGKMGKWKAEVVRVPTDGPQGK